jgi:hypothetical protein
MHFALTQAANTISMYGYTLAATGLDTPLVNLDGGAEKVRGEATASIDEINEVLRKINEHDILGIVKSAGTATDRFIGWADSTIDNPKQAIQLLVQYALGQGESALLELLLRPLVEHYLANGEMSGAEYLDSFRIITPLEFYDFTLPKYIPAAPGQKVGSVTTVPFNDSILLNKDGNVWITVRYDVEYSFMGLPLPFEPKLGIVQSVMTKMWRSGSGDGYED